MTFWSVPQCAGEKNAVFRSGSSVSSFLFFSMLMTEAKAAGMLNNPETMWPHHRSKPFAFPLPYSWNSILVFTVRLLIPT